MLLHTKVIFVKGIIEQNLCSTFQTINVINYVLFFFMHD